LLLKFIKLPLLFPFVWFAQSSLSSEKTGPLKQNSYDSLFSPMSIYKPIIGETELRVAMVSNERGVKGSPDAFRFLSFGEGIC